MNPAPLKKTKSKNLSPAKKFRLRLRRAKFQKQQQAQDEYFEHDNRGGKPKLSKKGRRAQMYIDAYLKTQRASQNGDTASHDDTQDSSNGTEVTLKSIVQRAAIGLAPVTSRALVKNQAALNVSLPTATAGNNTAKCCCHCACAVRKKKPRRKLSSPYFGDFNRAVGSCAGDAKAVTTTTTTTHHETLLKAPFVAFQKLPAKMSHPVFDKKFNGFQSRTSATSGLGELRSVVRFV